MLFRSITVTKQDVAAALEWDRKREARKIYEAAKIIECPWQTKKFKLDGDPSEWESPSATLNGQDASLAMSYDDTNLYFCFRARGAGPLKNTGKDWRKLFKTGAAVDLNIGLDSKADVKRQSAAIGDLRLLMTEAGPEPTAVLYQPNAPGSKPEEAWETHTDVAQSSFDRVARLKDVQIAVRTEANSYCVEAVVPLKSIGLKIEPNASYKFDWGILVSGPGGSEVTQRLY